MIPQKSWRLSDSPSLLIPRSRLWSDGESCSTTLEQWHLQRFFRILSGGAPFPDSGKLWTFRKRCRVLWYVMCPLQDVLLWRTCSYILKRSRERKNIITCTGLCSSVSVTSYIWSYSYLSFYFQKCLLLLICFLSESEEFSSIVTSKFDFCRPKGENEEAHHTHQIYRKLFSALFWTPPSTFSGGLSDAVVWRTWFFLEVSGKWHRIGNVTCCIPLNHAVF